MSKSLVEAALRYREVGLSVIPCSGHSKYPDLDVLRRAGNVDFFGHPVWGPLQRRLPTPAEIQSWFATEELNLALVTGYRELLILDFDDVSCFERWNQKHGDFCSSTSVQRSARGYHVLVHWSRVWSTRFHTGIGFQLLGEGDQEAGSLKGISDYVIAWPSIHPSGEPYRWLPGQAPWEVGVARIRALEDVGLEPTKKIPQAYFVFVVNALTRPRWGAQLLSRWLKQRIGKARGAKTIY